MEMVEPTTQTLIFTVALTVQRTDTGQIQIHNASWAGLEPVQALPLIQQVVIEQKARELIALLENDKNRTTITVPDEQSGPAPLDEGPVDPEEFVSPEE